MRRYSIYLVGLVAVGVCASAQASSPAALTINAASHQVLYGREVALTGRLSGGSVAGKTVVITATPYGASAPHAVAKVESTGAGVWTYRAKPRIQTIYQAHVGSLLSPPITLGVAPRVSLTELGNGRIRVQVAAGRSLAGRTIQLQRLDSGIWQPSDRQKLSSASIAIFPPILPTSTIRAALSVNQAGAGLLGAKSHALRYHPLALVLKLPALNPAAYGVSTILSGRLVNGGAGERVTIYAHRYGHAGVVKVTTVKTSADGRFVVPVVPTVRTTYQASFGHLKKSAAVILGVRPTLTLIEGKDGSLTAHLKFGPTLRGRDIKLQRLTQGKWLTIAQEPLDRNLNASFHVQLAVGGRIRAALSVNQAGAGYLGATSDSFVYH